MLNFGQGEFLERTKFVTLFLLTSTDHVFNNYVLDIRKRLTVMYVFFRVLFHFRENLVEKSYLEVCLYCRLVTNNVSQC
jgi:hypothetical protein